MFSARQTDAVKKDVRNRVMQKIIDFVFNFIASSLFVNGKPMYLKYNDYINGVKLK